MKTMKRIAMPALAVLILSACGGGGVVPVAAEPELERDRDEIERLSKALGAAAPDARVVEAYIAMVPSLIAIQRSLARISHQGVE